jgi:hypothetical protein
VPHIPPERAFDFWPTFDLKLGPDTLVVPPLSIGRFLGVSEAAGRSSSDLTMAMATILDTFAHAKGTDPQIIGKTLGAFPPSALWPMIEAVVPRLTAKQWEEYGGIVEAMDLLKFFVDTHDWELVGQELGAGEKHETPSRITVLGAMTMLARAAGRPMEDLLGLRLEGFFYYQKGIREAAERDAEVTQPEVSAEPEDVGVTPQKDPGRLHQVWSVYDAADAAAKESGNG